MAVYDRWHKSRIGPGEPRCREHDLVPSSVHGVGDRWQVRWRNEEGRQKKQNFARKTGKDPEVHADAFDARTQATLDDGSYIDPSSGEVTFRKFAEDWRKNRPHDPNTARRIELQLRLHVYPAVGHRTMRELGKRPSLTQAWIAGIKLAPSSAGQVIRDVSAIYIAAVEDGVMSRNPLASKAVIRPEIRDKRLAQTWTLGQLDSLAARLPARHQIIPYLGAGTGQRQGEMFGLAIDDEDPDIDFLRRVVHIRRQVRLVGSTLCFSPVKNNKPHDVPLGDSLTPALAEHLRLYPAVPVTLPWLEPDGDLVTHKLILTRSGGLAMHRDRADDDWKDALVAAGLVPPRKKGDKRWPAPGNGMHRLRHTAASAWLSAGVNIAAVAEWLGDTVATVQMIYAHMMPGDAGAGRRAVDAFFRPCAPDVPSATSKGS
jgi:integrase